MWNIAITSIMPDKQICDSKLHGIYDAWSFEPVILEQEYDYII